ncbi:MAG: Fic family protein [Oscillospiraceae bacterium]|jgi:hypothetical protein|nr:Fic family protein [Oscillospiraceae bacterium]
MEDRFNMTVEQNIFLAKRNVVDYIWKSANLEGIAVTFPETNAIFEGAACPGISVEDTIKINNLKRAWAFLLDTLDRPLDFEYLCRLNMIIGGDGSIYGAGRPRTYDVRITGTKWQPQIPIEYDIRNEMADIFLSGSPAKQAVRLMLWCMRRQIFVDGNKRTAALAANKVMIANGCGIISIPNELIKQFGELLIAYYETGALPQLETFIFENCIDGIAFDENK